MSGLKYHGGMMRPTKLSLPPWCSFSCKDFTLASDSMRAWR